MSGLKIYDYTVYLRITIPEPPIAPLIVVDDGAPPPDAPFPVFDCPGIA